MKKGKKTALIAGLLALGVGVSAFTAKYRAYLTDPDFWSKVQYDLTHCLDCKDPSVLLELFVKGNPEDFKRTLEEEIEMKYSFKQPPAKREMGRFQKQGFGNKEILIAYLQDNNEFIKASIKQGYYRDAAIAGHKIYDPLKILQLLKWGEIQAQITGIPLEIRIQEESRPTKINLEYPEKFANKEWLLRLKHDLTALKEYSPQRVIKELGETKKRIFALAKERYRSALQKYPELMDDREKRNMDKLLKGY